MCPPKPEALRIRDLAFVYSRFARGLFFAALRLALPKNLNQGLGLSLVFMVLWQQTLKSLNPGCRQASPR